MTRGTHWLSVAGLLAAALTWGSSVAQAQAPSIVMASTTSTEQSGLFSHLLPAFKQATGMDVKVVALGTGQALDTGRRGDADVLFVHDQVAEEKFVAEGFGVKVPKGYIYAAMAFSAVVEGLNMLSRRSRARLQERAARNTTQH